MLRAKRAILTLAPDGAAGSGGRLANMRQILAAAETVFAESGFSAASMSRIAHQAGLPKANLHYYFGTKENLYRALLEDILTTWLAAAAEWISPGRPPAEALAGYVRAKMAHSRARPAASRIFASEVLCGAPHIMEFLGIELRRQVAEMAQVMEIWFAAGLLPRIPPAHLLFNIWAMTQTYADFQAQITAVLGKRVLDDAEFHIATETVVRLVVQGCGLPLAPAPLSTK